jgi:hypothetical protein
MAGRNAMKIFIDNPSEQILPLIKVMNERKVPFEEISVVEADFFDYFQVKPWKTTKTGESVT